ncbi:MAG: amidophosphoribosyltransferase [Candidatus Nezhaarchaeales archaeon]
MGGVIGLYAFDELWRMSRFTYYGLLALQHRGQESAGISTYGKNLISTRKAAGTVDKAFSEADISSLEGWASIGYVSAEPLNGPEPVQPVTVNSPIRLTLCYDGRVLNLAGELKGRREDEASLVATMLSRELSRCNPLEAVEEVMERLIGVYSLIALTERGEMIAFRDPLGVKPMVIGSFGFDYGVIASESCAIDVVGAEFKADVKPGEAYVFTPYSIDRRQILPARPRYCSYEYVYLARPDSIVNERSIYDVRRRIGRMLAEECPVDADVVIGVPETAIPFAMAYSNATGIPIEMGFMRTGPHVRSAIKPTQFERLVGVQLKLNAIRSAISGKRVILIDDSVVRGNTTKNVVSTMRNRLGVKEVHVRIGSPRIIEQCPFGVEVPPKDELIAAHLTDEEVASVVGADSFHWLSIDALIKALGCSKDQLCLGCFTGEYPEIVKEALSHG